MIFRLSQKLATKLKEGTLPTVPLDENPYADWSAHLFTADRTQYIIVANTQALYSVVLYGRGISDFNTFIDRALGALREFMEDDGLSFIYQRFVAPASERIRFSPPISFQQLLRSLGKHLSNLSPFAFDPWDFHRLVSGGLVPHPGNDGGFGTLFHGDSLRPGDGATSDRRSVFRNGMSKSLG
jgi:hypothetical protein